MRVFFAFVMLSTLMLAGCGGPTNGAPPGQPPKPGGQAGGNYPLPQGAQQGWTQANYSGLVGQCASYYSQNYGSTYGAGAAKYCSCFETVAAQNFPYQDYMSNWQNDYSQMQQAGIDSQCWQQAGLN
jgi:hypothetical protein